MQLRYKERFVLLVDKKNLLNLLNCKRPFESGIQRDHTLWSVLRNYLYLTNQFVYMADKRERYYMRPSAFEQDSLLSRCRISPSESESLMCCMGLILHTCHLSNQSRCTVREVVVIWYHLALTPNSHSS